MATEMYASTCNKALNT